VSPGTRNLLFECAIVRRAHSSTGGQNPSAVARARCQGYGPPGCSPPRPLLKLSGRQGPLSADGSPRSLSKTYPDHPNRMLRCALRSDTPRHCRGLLLALWRPDYRDDAVPCSFLNGCHPRPVNGHMERFRQSIEKVLKRPRKPSRYPFRIQRPPTLIEPLSFGTGRPSSCLCGVPERGNPKCVETTGRK
jgi:hypothetical protein